LFESTTKQLLKISLTHFGYDGTDTGGLYENDFNFSFISTSVVPSTGNRLYLINISILIFYIKIKNNNIKIII
jgi:hypothetical protein